jgi:hypothetical protein
VKLEVRVLNLPTINSAKAKPMKLHLNPILKFWIDVERENLRNGSEEIVQILQEWEAEGDAMRYVGQDGQICWQATPKFIDRVCDAKLDAIEEFEAL